MLPIWHNRHSRLGTNAQRKRAAPDTSFQPKAATPLMRKRLRPIRTVFHEHSTVPFWESRSQIGKAISCYYI